MSGLATILNTRIALMIGVAGGFQTKGDETVGKLRGHPIAHDLGS